MSNMGQAIEPLELDAVQVTGEVPGGARNAVNDTYTTADKFLTGSLAVFLDGRNLTPGLDFIELAGNQSFKVLTNAADGNRLSSPPEQTEDLLVNYIRLVAS